MKAPLPPDEAQRLKALRQYEVLDTPPEEAYDDIAALAAQICQVPMAMISLVDKDRQWFKSRIGVSATETTRDIAFCAHTILHKEEMLEVRDAEADPRFSDSPLVTSDPHVRFYAGSPLVSPDGHALGALCVMDRSPHELTADQRMAMRVLGRHVVTQLELRRKSREMEEQFKLLARHKRETEELLALADKSRRAILSVLEDEKLSAQNLRESEERFRQLAENINEVFWLTNPSKNEMLYVGPAYEKIWGRRCADLYTSPHTWLDAIHTEDRDRVRQASQTKQLAGTYNEEYRIVQPDGSIRWIQDRAFPVREASGEIHRIAGVARDITARKRAEEELRESERRFADMLRNLELVALMLDRDARITYCNDYLLRLTGWRREEVLGRDWFGMFLAPENLEEMRGVYSGLLADKPETWHHENEILTRSGARCLIAWNNSVLRSVSGEVIGTASIGEDITERKRAMEQIREQAALLDKAQDAIMVCDIEGRVFFWNKAAERIYGWTHEEAWGKRITEIFGTETPKEEEAYDALAKCGEWSGELQKTAKDGRKLILETRWVLLRDEAGEPKSLFAIATDITEKKKIEAQFLRAQRMESIGTLASGIAHDLNNILAPIMMSVEVLKSTIVDPHSGKMLDTLENCAQRGADIVRQVLSFGRGMEGHSTEIQPRHLLKDLEGMIKETFPKDIRLRFSAARDLWTIMGDPTQLHQVLLNLCVNARDAMPHGGEIAIEVENRTLDGQYAAANPQAGTGDYVVISVTDTGTGIPAEILDKIFDPFFTTKEIGKGTGLGLSTVQGIVKSHGGFLNVYSEPGKGTAFHLYFPAVNMQGTGDEQDRQAALPRGNGETVLVIDDEASILTITGQTLEAFGYKVLTAGNGTEAVAVYARHDREIALVLTDMMMPVMDGASTIHALQKMNPVVKIIAASGLGANENVARAANAGVKHFLAKPYSAATLLIKFREVLDEVPPAGG